MNKYSLFNPITSIFLEESNTFPNKYRTRNMSNGVNNSNTKMKRVRLVKKIVNPIELK